jgi:photosystem II stability/assembly factor-like uncharacterized protein
MKNLILVLFAFFFFTSFLLSQTIQWQKLNGPFGGTPLCFVSKGSERFVGMDQNQGGVFRSSDDETAWGQESSGIDLADRAINWLAVDDSGYIIAGTGSHIGSRVYKSKDNGESWVKIANLGGTSGAQNDSGHIYVGDTGYGQYSFSKDGGYSWTHFPSPAAFTYCITINDSGHIFIGGNYTGYRSTDNGATWNNLPLPDGINSIAFAPNGDVYAGCSREYASNSGVYKSTDNGDNWTPVKEGFRVYRSHNIAINNAGDIFVGSDGWGIWRSTDDGATWTQQNSGLHHFYIRSMYILNDENIYAGATGGGIYRSTDNGEDWQQVGVIVAGVKNISINPTNGYLFAAVNGVSRSTDGGQTWKPINSGLANLDTRTFTIKEDGTIFCGTGFNYNVPGVIFRSSDNGNNWVRADTGIAWRTQVNAMAVDDYGNIYAGAYDGVYKSINNGSSWFNIGAEGGAKGLTFNSVGDLFMAKDAHGVWRLLKNDTSWTHLTDGSGYNIFCGRNDNLYCGNFRSTDNGDNWTRMSIDYFTSSFAENSIGHLFCGTFNYGSGVWRSTDYGNTWTQINNGLPTMDIRSVAVDADDYLYAGTNGYSMYKTTTSTVTSVENENELPTTFYLEQNYPNPFNPSTVISYQIPASLNPSKGGTLVTLRVYDILGNEIATLVNEYKPAGSYEVEFSTGSFGKASQLSSGIYFYRLKADEFIQTRKMILLR